MCAFKWCDAIERLPASALKSLGTAKEKPKKYNADEYVRPGGGLLAY